MSKIIMPLLPPSGRQAYRYHTRYLSHVPTRFAAANEYFLHNPWKHKHFIPTRSLTIRRYKHTYVAGSMSQFLSEQKPYIAINSTFALIKPVPPSQHGKIITYIMKKGFRIVRMKNGKVGKDFAMDLYKNIGSSNMLPIIIDYVTSGEVIGLELVGPEAVSSWRACLGATDPEQAAPGTLRKLYGENKLKNIAHGCESVEEAAMMLDLFFGVENGLPRIPFRATFKECTCCVIKPHAIIDGNVGAILEQISTSGKFYISAMAMFAVKLVNAEEFFEVYKGVLPEYEAMSIQLAEGKCIALEIKCTKPGMNCVCEFRKFCGPRDPDLCRQLYPDTIRALYGKTIVLNAVHCTDLPEDGESEVEYFFKLLAND